MPFADFIRAIASDYGGRQQREQERMVNSLMFAEKIRGERQTRDIAQEKLNLEKEESNLRQTKARRDIRGGDVAEASRLAEWSDAPQKVGDAGTGLGDLVLDPKVRNAILLRQQREKETVEAEGAGAAEAARLSAQGYGKGKVPSKAELDAEQVRIQALRASQAGMGGHGSGYGDNIGWQNVYGGPDGRQLIARVKMVADENSPNGFRQIYAPVTTPDGKPVYGGAAPLIAQGGRNTIAARDAVLNQIDNLRPAVTKISESFGPIAGRVLKFKTSQILGGYGTTPEERAAVLQMRTLLMNKSFSEGGKNLTGTELQLLTDILNDPTDTFDMTISKLEEAKKIISQQQMNDLLVIPEVQRGQIDARFWGRVGLPAPAGVGTTPTAPTASGRISNIRLKQR